MHTMTTFGKNWKRKPVSSESFWQGVMIVTLTLMKSFLIILLISFSLSQCGGAKPDQKETAGSRETGTSDTQKDWKTVNVAVADLSLTMPTELSKESSSNEPNRNGDVTWTEYDYTWEKPREDRDLPRYEVNVSVTNWDNDFPANPVRLSPEAMLEMDYSADERYKNEGTAPIEELSYLEIDGVKGEFFRAVDRDDKNRIWLSWHTFRHHRDKAQRLAIRVYGERSNLEKLTQIVRSAKLAKK
jgi:hypothetical protein